MTHKQPGIALGTVGLLSFGPVAPATGTPRVAGRRAGLEA